MASHVQRTIKELKDHSREVGIVERFVNIKKVLDDIELVNCLVLLTAKEQNDLQRICGITKRLIHNNNAPPGVRSDLFGLFDLIAMNPRQGVIGIQVCGPDFSSHYKKITQEKADSALLWLSAGRGNTKIEIWSWRKILEKSGGKKRIWKPRIKRISYQDFKGHCRSDKDIEAAWMFTLKCFQIIVLTVITFAL